MSMSRAGFGSVVVCAASGFLGAASAMLLLRPAGALTAGPLAQAPRALEVSELILRDPEGNKRAHLRVDESIPGGSVNFNFLDADGKSLGNMTFNSRGSLIAVHGAKCVASMLAGKSASFVQANGPEGGASLHATSDPDKVPYVDIGGADGASRVITVKGSEVKNKP